VVASFSSSLSLYPGLDRLSGRSLNNRARGKTGLQSKWNQDCSIRKNFACNSGITVD